MKINRDSVHPQNSDVAAEIASDTVYLNFSITLYDRTFQDWCNGKSWTVANTIVHEFCHILTNPFMMQLRRRITPIEEDEIENMHERQTQRIANIFLNLIDPEVYKIETADSES